MPVSTKETEAAPPGHQRRRRRSSEGSSACGSTASNPAGGMPTSTSEAEMIDEPGRRRRSKRPSTLSSAGSPPSSHPSWVILGRTVARRDNFAGDGTTSSISRTTTGEEISASLELAEPPATSVLSLDMPGGHDPSDSSMPYPAVVLAAHRDVVLFEEMTFRGNKPPSDLTDYFVYRAGSSDGCRRRPSLSLLPVLYREHTSLAGRHRHQQQQLLYTDHTGILSRGSKKKGSSSSFVVALLESPGPVLAEHNMYLFRSGSDNWDVFRKLHVHGANGGNDLLWWSTDAVVPYRRRFLIWVDYYRGMIVADMANCWGTEPAAPPELRYVALPVDTVAVNPTGSCGRGRPAASRSVCATRSGIKFVSVDHQEISSFGLGRMRTWTSTFRITTWSLREDDYTWIKEATMDPDELWAALDKSAHQFPRVPPKYPVVNMENPDAVCFLLDTYELL